MNLAVDFPNPLLAGLALPLRLALSLDRPQPVRKTNASLFFGPLLSCSRCEIVYWPASPGSQPWVVMATYW